MARHLVSAKQEHSEISDARHRRIRHMIHRFPATVSAMATALALVISALAPAGAACQTATVCGSVSIGDTSTAPPDLQLVLAVTSGPAAATCGNFSSFGNNLCCRLGHAGDWTFSAYANYYGADNSDPVPCRIVNGLLTCSGAFALKLYAPYGAISGTVTDVSSGAAPNPPVDVIAMVDGQCGIGNTARTDAFGHYEFLWLTEPGHSNNWGLSLINHVLPAVPGAAYTVPFRVGIAGSTCPANTVDVIVSSSAMTRADLSVIAPGTERPSGSCPRHVGHPVNVASGNVYFDQPDVSIPGVSTQGLRFVRRYNSLKRNAGQYGL